MSPRPNLTDEEQQRLSEAHTIPDIARRAIGDLTLIASMAEMYGAPLATTRLLEDAASTIMGAVAHIK
jgi:hypothetical protein